MKLRVQLCVLRGEHFEVRIFDQNYLASGRV